MCGYTSRVGEGDAILVTSYLPDDLETWPNRLDHIRELIIFLHILKCLLYDSPNGSLFAFPYYFTIPNSEICTANFGIRTCEVYVAWASGNN